MDSVLYKYVVPGLDVLIGDPKILSPSINDKKYAEVFFIPEGYIYEVIDSIDEKSGEGDAAKELNKYFKRMLSSIKEPDAGFELDNKTLVKIVRQADLCLDQNLIYPRNRSFAQAILTAEYINKTDDLDAAIMTRDDALTTLAACHKIKCVPIDDPEVYTGRRRVFLSFESSALWYSNHKITAEEWEEYFPKESPLKANEFVEFVHEVDNLSPNYSFVNVGRFDQYANALVPLKYVGINCPTGKIWPKTAGQAMLLEALLTPPEEIPIVVVSGVFGTGKTFLSVAAGYFGTAKQDIYERVFVCPRDGALGERIGFVPGDATEKTLVKSRPIIDNLRSILRILPDNKRKKTPDNMFARRDCIDNHVDDVLDRYFEFEPVIFMGGRSIENCFIIYDEFQDMDRYQARSLLSRIGNNSKIVVSGDPTQHTNPRINRSSNGLDYVASRLAGKPMAAVITLTKEEIVRSPAAIAIAKCLD